VPSANADSAAKQAAKPITRLNRAGTFYKRSNTAGSNYPAEAV